MMAIIPTVVLATIAPGQVASDAATNGLRDIKPPVEIFSLWSLMPWVIAALLLMALAVGLLVFLILRTRHRPAPPLIPAHVRARQALDDALSLLSQPKPFVIAISDTLRGYLEERFQFRAPERTTEEFLLDLQRTSLLTQTQKDSLGEFLQRCDLVKFARYEPTERELRDLHAAAARLVNETEPRHEFLAPKAESENQESESGLPPVQKIVNRKS
jgi:hypothetical protein